MSTAPLWNRIRQRGMRTLSVMGMTKNTGKTVVLNHLLAAAAAEHVAVGVTSIGRDGEARDQVFSIPKPPVRVWAGTVIATARGSLPRARVRWKLIDGTGIDSPMGEILVVRAEDDGEMEIAGASRSSDQHAIIARLRQCGAEMVLLDGALGRSHHASPAIADGVVLATGAAIGGGIGDVLRKTADRLAILRIDAASDDMRERCAPVFAMGGVSLWNAQGESVFCESIATLNAAPVLHAHAEHGVALIALSGAVGRAVWAAVCALAERQPGLVLVVADGTKLFVENADVVALQKRGGAVQAMRGIVIAGVTLNPFSPFGGSFAAQEFLDAARATFAGYAVSDVLWEEKLMKEGLMQ